MTTPQQADVVIVGTGVAAALCGYRLSQAGAKVLFLEAGTYVADRSSLMQAYYAAFPKLPESPYANHPLAPRPVSGNTDAYYVQTGADSFQGTYERCVGGSTWHWLGTALRLLPEDFHMHTHYGVGVDWPITYEALCPWYDEAEQELGVAGDGQADLGSPRTGPYPKPAVRLTYGDLHIASRLRGKSYDGAPLVVQATPQARDPLTCQGSGSCVPICPTGAKYEAFTHIEKAKRLGAQVLDKCVVHKVHVGADAHVSHVEYRTWDGQDRRVATKVLVLAANAIETAKILLMSKSDRTPAGAANRSGAVGSYLMDHLVRLSWALAVDPVHTYRGPISTAGIDSTRRGTFRGQRAAYRVELHNDGWSWPTGAPHSTAAQLIEQGLWGETLSTTLRNHLTRQVSIASLVEQIPSPDCSVKPSSDQVDALGIPRPEIHFQVSDYEKRGFDHAHRAVQSMFEHIGVSESHHHSATFSAAHLMGTTRMGHDPKTSVVDSESRAHDHPNLYLLGSSVFPTAGTANPTLTLAALALKAAASVQETLAKIP